MRRPGFGFILAAAVTLLGPALPVTASATWQGALAMVSAASDTSRLAAGDETTLFTVRLPDRASCPGDTMHDLWQVQAFILPVGDDPSAQVYTGLGPRDHKVDGVVKRLALYDPEGAPWTAVNLPRNDSPGKPARIPTPPVLSFAQPATIGLASGQYRVGVGCSQNGDLRLYWSATVSIVRPADVSSPRLTWSVDGAAAPSPPGGSTDAVPIIAFACVAGVALLFTFRTARRRAIRSQRI